MKKILFVVLCILIPLILFSTAVNADDLYEFRFTRGGNNNVYVLPGEDITFSLVQNKTEKAGFKGFSVLSVETTTSCPSGLTFELWWWTARGSEVLREDKEKEYFFQEETGKGHIFLKRETDSLNKERYLYKFASDSGKNVDLFKVCNQIFSFFNTSLTYNPGHDFVHFDCSVKVIDEEKKKYSFNLSKNIIKTDGKRGDVNGDSQVDEKDVREMAFYSENLNGDDVKGRYTQSGVNFGRGIVLFSNLDLISWWLINIWVHNPNDPIVQGLGIGRMMSLTYRDIFQMNSNHYLAKPAGPTIVRNMPFESKIEGNRMVVSTEGHAVNVMAYLPDGKIWQDTKWVDNGKVEFQIPDPRLEYRIESTWIPGKASIQTFIKEDLPIAFSSSNHPNPFNPSTTIDFSLPKAGETMVDVFNVSGQKVATLASGFQSAGRHSLVWNAKSFSSGTYFCVIRQGNETRKIKMTLVK